MYQIITRDPLETGLILHVTRVTCLWTALASVLFLFLSFFSLMVDMLTVSWDDEVAFCPPGGQRTDSPLSSTFIFLTEHCTDEEVEPGGLCT